MSTIEILAVLSALCMWIIAGFKNAYDFYLLGKSTALTLVKGFFVGFLVTPVFGVILVIVGGFGYWLITPLIFFFSFLLSFLA